MQMQDSTVGEEVGIMVAMGTAVEAPDTILVSLAAPAITPDTQTPSRTMVTSPSLPPELTPAAGGHSPG